MRIFSLSIFFLLIAFFHFFSAGVQAKSAAKGFIHVSGRNLHDGNGRQFKFMGIAFGNDVWSNPLLPPSNHHTAADYAFIKSLGFNSVRFYMNYGIFEDDSLPYNYKESGFEWIKKNLEWASANGIYLILNMHVPQGGYQSNVETVDLWKNEQYQKRFIALWREIASRFKNEHYIGGYSILNEPGVYGGIDKWKSFSSETVSAIRSADPNHIIIAERMHSSVKSPGNADWSENVNGEMNFIKYNDSNVMYEFHFYKPFQFTHQGASWIPAMRNTHTVYPGKFRDWDNSEKLGDKMYIASEISRFTAFSRKHNVPLYLGEFGCIRAAYEDGKNGTGWVGDVIDICDENGISFNYHVYHGQGFGLYSNGEHILPDDLNEQLSDFFSVKLKK